MTQAVATQQKNPVAAFSSFMDRFKPQLALALPKHLTADRMARLACTAFSNTPKLQECTPMSIAASIMTASTLGLEPGVNGQGFLVPYGRTCTFVPGWKGLVDIANRSGRCTVWTGAVFAGDHFEYALGDRPFVTHRPGDEDDPAKLTHVYAIGRVNGSDHPVIEVWTIRKIWKHRDQYNKVGGKHYSFRDHEMYARKIPLLQVLKYMPSSIELNNAMAVANAQDGGSMATIDATGMVTIMETPPEQEERQQEERASESTGKPEMTDAEFARNLPIWRGLIESGKKSIEEIIATAQTKHKLAEHHLAMISATVTEGEAAE
jgi:recombination protein RecT